MTEPLTDEQLIQLVQEKTPEELSSEEIELLRERLETSDELREILIGQLHMESYLNTALNEITIDPQTILQRANALQQQLPKKNGSYKWWVLLFLMMLTGGGAWAWSVRDVPEELPDSELLAQNEEKLDLPENTEKTEAATPVENNETTENPAELPDETPGDLPADAPFVPQPNKVPQPPKLPDEIWASLLDPDEPVHPFSETAFQDFWVHGRSSMPEKRLTKWIDSVPGYGMKLKEQDAGNRKLFTHLEGTAKLKAPWTADAVLRLGLYDMDLFQILIWQGETGIWLRYLNRSEPKVWVAYRITRSNTKKLEPETFTLLDCDNGRHYNTREGSFELRHQNGHLVMTRGNLRLLTVPLAEVPQDVYFLGKAFFQGLTMFRGEPAPDDRALENVPEVIAFAPDDLSAEPWTTDLRDGSVLEFPTPQSARLSHHAEPDDRQVLKSWLNLPRKGLYDIRFKMDDIHHGAGVFLGDENGKPFYYIGGFLEKDSGQTGIRGEPNHPQSIEHPRNPEYNIVSTVEGARWVRVVAGVSSMKVWLSDDGIHWAHIQKNADRFSTKPIETIGLYLCCEKEDRAATISNLEIRELSTITSLVPEGLLTQAREIEELQLTDYAEWNYQVTRRCPEGVTLREWKAACGIATIELGNSALRTHLLQLLVEDTLEQERPASEQYRFLNEVALLADLWQSYHAQQYASHYAEVGTKEVNKRTPRAIPTMLHAYLTAPIWNYQRVKLESLAALREPFLALAYTENWSELREALLELHYWNHTTHPHWFSDYHRLQESHYLKWAESISAAQLGIEDTVSGKGLQETWQHPLLSEFSKEGYNLMAEFEAAIRGKAWEDACQIISAAGESGPHLLGLLPDAEDPQLMISLTNAVDLAMQSEPELRDTMRKEQGPIGQLRVRQAITQNDAENVEAATVQYYGTRAAAEAHRWLGNRALASGKLSQAMEHFEAGLETTSTVDRPQLLAVMRLTSAMQGLSFGHPPKAEVVLGEQVVSPELFERMIAKLITARRKNSISVKEISPQNLSLQSLKPGRYKAEQKGTFQGNYGEKLTGYQFQDTDWAARQFATTTDGKVLYVSNRFQVVAYDAETGKELWTRRLDGEQGLAHDYWFVPAKPLLIGEQLYVRRYTKQGFELACLEAKTGKVLWRNLPDREVISDPVFVRQKLIALVKTTPGSNQLQIEMATFDTDTGDILSQRPLCRFRDEWNGDIPCTLTTGDNLLICNLGGAVLCADILGHPRWVRKQQWLKWQSDPHWRSQSVQEPVVHDGKVFITQPGVKTVSCLDLQSGRELWKRVLPEIVRIACCRTEILVVQTMDRFFGYDLETGEQRWEHDTGNVLEGLLCEENQLAYTRSFANAGSILTPCLVWLDITTGEQLGLHPLEELRSEKRVMIGPLVPTENRVWLFRGHDGKTGQRDLMQLSLQSEDLPGGFPKLADRRWQHNLIEKSHFNTGTVLPSWEILTPQVFTGKFKGAEYHPEFRGESNVLLTMTGNARPVRLFRQLKLPETGASNLRCRIGSGGVDWTFQVDVQGEKIVEDLVDEKSTKEGWRTVPVDLTPWQGKTVTIVVSAIPADPKRTSDVYWKTLEIVTEVEESP